MRFNGARKRIRRMAILGNHTPRQCGIATFTADLSAALRGFHGLECFVLAMNDPAHRYEYPEPVRVEIAQEEPASYRRAAEILNRAELDVLSIQHEYGIFGGEAGSHVLTLMREVRAPMVTTLHTILAEPDARQRATMDEIIERSERLVVMSSHGAGLLRQVHGVPADRIDLIPHGIPPVPRPGLSQVPPGLGGKRVLLTFGLLAPDKGIEYVIDAMPRILERFPEAVYVVLGASHPHVKARHGETYREMLEGRARNLGVAGSIMFHNRFVSLDELVAFLAAADIYATPYLKLEQSTSGTLAYALGSGKAVISTPYRYAQELLADGRGVLVPCRDPDAISRAVMELLTHEPKRAAMQRRALEYGRSMAWPVVAGKYLDAFCRAHEQVVDRTARRDPLGMPWARPGEAGSQTPVRGLDADAAAHPLA